MDKAKSPKEIIEGFINENPLAMPNRDRVFKICFNEAWFSNTLAWLLNPKGTHGLGVNFAKEFLITIAKIRTNGAKKKYETKGTLLKLGNKEPGRTPYRFSLKNATAVREFYLSKSMKNGTGRKPRYCDVAFFDLDPSDSLFVAVENKLFSSNHLYQLEDYYDLIEDKFRRTKTLEYVYLTLHGHAPVKHKKESERKYKYWVRMSWIDDIFSILENFEAQTKNREVANLRNLLGWIKKLCNKSFVKDIEKLRTQLIESSSNCLCEELERLNDKKTGSWEIRKQGRKRFTIEHTSFPAKPLDVELLPNLSITVHSKINGKALFEKIIVPYGSNTDQIYNLLDIAARDVCHHIFNGNKDRYLADKRHQKSDRSEAKTKNRNIFDFVTKNQNELQILFTMSDNIWKAQEFEQLES
jgi:hypothetical protein